MHYAIANFINSLQLLQSLLFVSDQRLGKHLMPIRAPISCGVIPAKR
jgi:hypothetical protein